MEGNAIGRGNTNPILDTQTYKVEFEYGSMRTYSANVTEESMYAQCDEEGKKYLLFR